jgi:undecaprenyl diphosphate synthase
MELFLRALENEVARLHENGIRFRVIGDLAGFSERIQALIRDAEALTCSNTRLTFTVAANYGGRWDIVQAVKQLMAMGVAVEAVDEAALQQHLSMAEMPEPDLFIRTGGEQRISNFLLWQAAYAELWFTETLWPDVDAGVLDAAFDDFARRQRRYGLTGAQTDAGEAAP